jgi:hypothetical protein
LCSINAPHLEHPQPTVSFSLGLLDEEEKDDDADEWCSLLRGFDDTGSPLLP